VGGSYSTCYCPHRTGEVETRPVRKEHSEFLEFRNVERIGIALSGSVGHVARALPVPAWQLLMEGMIE
jgi:hypothetical protein